MTGFIAKTLHVISSMFRQKENKLPQFSTLPLPRITWPLQADKY